MMCLRHTFQKIIRVARDFRAHKLDVSLFLLYLISMPFHLELGSDGNSFKGKAIVVNSKTGKHYSSSPIPLAKAEAQKRVLEQAYKKENTQ